MASRTRLAWAAASLLGLLTGCLDQRMNRDRFRAIRNDTPPRPAATLQIPTPPTAALAAGESGTRPASYVAPLEKPNPPVQPALLTQPAGTAAPAVQPAAGQGAQAPAGVSPLRQVYQKAAQRWATIDSYIVRLKRREAIGGKLQPDELMLVKFRKEPFSIYFKWLGEQARGREVLYVQGCNDNQILTLNGARDMPFMSATFVIKMAPDSPLVKGRSRYPITEAGFGSTIQRFGTLVERNERGDSSWGTLRYVGQVRRPEFAQPLEEVVQSLSARCDPLLPAGGQRHWFFDTEQHLPLLITATDQAGREVEYYCHDHFIAPANLDDNDFNPERLWGKGP